MAHDVTFGFNVPTFAGAPEDGTLTHINSPVYESLDWETTREAIRLVDDLGYDSLWAPDHFMLGRDHAIYECWTLLSTAAAITEDVRLGPLVLCNDFRNPALLAKMAATLDVISDGRVELGLGAGSLPADYRAYGWEHRDGFERLMRLDESIRLIKAMWTQDAPSFEGSHYRIENAYCNPGPVQDPHPPIVVGGSGEEVTLKLVAKHADVWNTTTMRGRVDDLAHKMDVIERHCETVGRDYNEIEMSWEGLVLPTREERTLDRILDRLLPMNRNGDTVETKADLQAYVPVGTPEECAEFIEKRVDLGVTTFMFYFLDYPDFRGIELFADEVMPEF